MRDKFSWYASAFLLWMIAGFIGVLAMFVKGFEGMLGGVDASEIAVAGAYGIICTACVVAMLGALVPMVVRRERVSDVCADLLAQCCALLMGGLLAVVFATFSLIGAAIATAVAWALFAPMLKTCERRWLRYGLPGLACATAAVPIVLNLL